MTWLSKIELWAVDIRFNSFVHAWETTAENQPEEKEKISNQDIVNASERCLIHICIAQLLALR
jgi:hypothetical protein